MGKAVLTAVSNVNDKIAPALIGMDAWAHALSSMSVPAIELSELRMRSAYSVSALACARGGTVLMEYATLQKVAHFRASSIAVWGVRHDADLIQ